MDKIPVPPRSCTALLLALATTPLHAAPDQSVNFAIGGLPRLLPHCAAYVYGIEYERSYAATDTLLFRATGVNYRFDNALYQENGRIQGLDAGSRHYLSGGMEGFFWDWSLGYWAANWDFSHQIAPNQPQGKASSHSIRLNFGIGARYTIPGTAISLMPVANIGKFFTSSSCSYAAPASLVGTACTQKSEVNGYLFVGIAAGVAF